MNGAVIVIKLIWWSYAFYYNWIDTVFGFKNPSGSLRLPSLVFPHRMRFRHQATENVHCTGCLIR
jgi:hypothetical protein